MAQNEHPELQIFMSLLAGTLWRAPDSGRQVVIDWLYEVASKTLATDQSSDVEQRREKFREALTNEDIDSERHPSRAIKNPQRSAYAFRLWPDKVQALVTYDNMRLNDLSLPWTVRNGRYMPAGLHTPRLTVVAVRDLTDRNFPGTYAYFFAEPQEAGPIFFDGLPPQSFLGARPKSTYYNTCKARISSQLQALADIFSDHERFLVGELQPFLDRSGNLANAPTFGILDGAFLRNLMASIQRWPTLEDIREAIKTEQHALCAYIETIRFSIADGLADKLQTLGGTYLNQKS